MFHYFSCAFECFTKSIWKHLNVFHMYVNTYSWMEPWNDNGYHWKCKSLIINRFLNKLGLTTWKIFISKIWFETFLIYCFELMTVQAIIMDGSMERDNLVWNWYCVNAHEVFNNKTLEEFRGNIVDRFHEHYFVRNTIVDSEVVI